MLLLPCATSINEIPFAGIPSLRYNIQGSGERHFAGIRLKPYDWFLFLGKKSLVFKNGKSSALPSLHSDSPGNKKIDVETIPGCASIELRNLTACQGFG